MANTEEPKTKKSLIEAIFGYLATTPPTLMFIHLAWIIIASCALSFAYVASFHFTSLLSIYREAHNIQNFSTNLRVSARQDQEIERTLQTLLDSTNSNRAYVFRYHNGLAAINGVPFFFQTLTHEVISPGTPRVLQFEQRIPTSVNIAVNNRFIQNECSVISNTAQDRDSQNYWYFQSRGAVDLIRCPIFMPNGDLFGFIGIDYTSDVSTDKLTADAAKVKEAARIIARLFVTRPGQQPATTPNNGNSNSNGNGNGNGNGNNRN